MHLVESPHGFRKIFEGGLTDDEIEGPRVERDPRRITLTDSAGLTRWPGEQPSEPYMRHLLE